MAITDAEGICNIAMHRLGANKVSDITTSPTSAEEIACNDIYEQIRDEMLMGIFSVPELGDYNWQFAKRHQQLYKAFGYDETDGFDEMTITGITAANPAVVTAVAHGFTNGWQVYIDNVSGMVEMNGLYVRVSEKADDTFECYGLDSTNFTAYTSGGTVVRKEPLADYATGYGYDFPADFLKIVTLEDKDAQYELVGSGDSERLLSNYEEPILVYIAQITTVTEFPIGFIRALAGRIAYELAPSLSPKNVDAIYKMYAVDVKDAIEADAKNVTPGSLIEQKNRIVDEGGWG
jgi:hypothetical protein